jgi:thiol-disulfide isomerase/thioredoxin
MLSRFKTALAAVAVIAAAATSIAITTTSSPASAAPLSNTAPEFTGIDNWLNSPPLTLQQLRGKVVLVDFWTYTCPNCINTLPYVKSWNQKYKDQGLTVIGVHTPEYPFERNTENVQKAIARFGITYPVAQDNRYATWGAYNNQYWPAFYLIDKKGQVVYTHFGEGDYAQTEAKIQALLAQKD